MNVGKILLLANKHRFTPVQNYTKKPEMPPVTFVGSLCKIHAVLCLKIADGHGIEVHYIRT